MMQLLLDTNLLKRVCYPKGNLDVKAWLQGWLDHAGRARNVDILISAVADYELRRGYLSELHRKDDERKALQRLNQLGVEIGVQQVSARNFLDAAAMWARARRAGKLTAGERDVDWDILIAAQAKEMTEQAKGLRVVVVTSNTKHLQQHGADAKDWHELPVPKDAPRA